MAESDNRLSTYIAAHRGKYEALNGAITQFIQDWDSRVVVKKDDKHDAVVKNGYDAAKFIEHFDISVDDAIEVARAQNRRLREIAEVAFVALQTEATRERLTDFRKKYPNALKSGKPIPWRRNQDDSKLLHYTDATYKIAEIQSSNYHYQYVELSTTQLGNLEGGGATEKARLIIDSKGILQKLAIASLDKAIRYVKFDIQPAHDELMQRAIEVLGPEQFTQTITPLMTKHGLDNLNGALNDLWADHQGRSTEEEVGPLLEQIKDRAIAVQHARDLNYELGTTMPSMEKLRELGTLFGIRF